MRDNCHYTGKFRRAAHSICNLRYKVPKNIPIVIHNHSTYDDHFIIKQLPEEFEGEFKCLGENTKKYITFSVPIKKEVNIDGGKEEDDGSDDDDDDDDDNDGKKKKTITYRINFIVRFMPCKLSDLVDNLSGIYNKERKSCMEGKKIRLECECIGFKNDRWKYKCKECEKYCTKSKNEATKNFLIMHQFCNSDLINFLCC